MKRGTPEHPKTKALALRLGLRRWQVVGILETLWHFTGQYAKRGDIGKWTNREIAAGLEWDGDPDKLIDDLLACRWLDPGERFRLLVHHWKDHCDQTVKRSEEVVKLGFASDELANASGMLANARQPSLSSPCLSKPSQSQSLSSPWSSAEGKMLDGDGDGEIWKEVKSKANSVLEVLKHKPKANIRRKIAACIYLAIQGAFPLRWIDENVDRAKSAKDDRWAYLWTCLRNEATDLEKDLCKMVATIDLPEHF